MSDVQYQTIHANDEGQRLDNYLMKMLKGVPKSHIYRIIRGGEVRVNKKRAQPSVKLALGDCIRIPPIRVAEEKTVFVGVKLEKQLQEAIIFEDSGLLVINKPAGIAVHGGSGVSLGVIEALRKMRSDLTYLELVHRLDRETSGCLLLAKKRSVLRTLQAALVNHEVTKTYWALLAHPWQGSKTQVVNASLKKNTLKSGERLVTIAEEGKPSQTTFKLLENFQHACWVEVTPKTGRTHQIRVHSAFLGHAIIGDEKYSKSSAVEDMIRGSVRLYLHARAIQFTLNNKEHRYEAKLDNRFAQTIEQLRSEFNTL
ncbi:ribosomal large subunit pseudouridine synthase [Legionella beliardensis]|uniref:Pseudouridine synthase n=1 Tax=Legionella beliardensis TaxID=91822 RepID=A0A378I3Q2_9GAMM|nr:RluA family pseudouridine synthase [Legionella beliardensis]STX29623.1 ribosomal large subunit pseudouridine synthase [Legionella beliardensis]